MKTTLLAVILVLVTGCSIKSPVDMAKDLPATADSSVSDCLKWVQDKEGKELEKYDSLASNDKAYALMHRETMSMVKDVFGKNQNVCKPGTNVWDAYIVWAQEQGKTKRQYSSDVKSVATVGILTTGAVKLADSLMGAAGDKISGNKTTAGGDVSTAGNDINDSSTKNTTNVNQTQVSTGDGTIEPVDSNSTTNVPPPEEEVLEEEVPEEIVTPEVVPEVVE